MDPTPSAGNTPGAPDATPGEAPGATPGEVRGAVLAGGRGSRLGGAKATVELGGRPLISYPLAALAAAGIEAFVVAKPAGVPGGLPLVQTPGRATTAPAPGAAPTETDAAALAPAPEMAPAEAVAALAPVEVITELAQPTHPLVGIVAALRHAGGPLVVLGCDFPFAPPALLRALAEAPEPLVVPAPGGEPQPLLARWSPPLLPQLEDALAREEPLRRTVAALHPRLLDDLALARFGDPAHVFLNVNTPADLRAAAAAL